MSISGAEWLIILAVIVLVFGRTRVLQLMGDAGRGLTNFRRGIADPACPGRLRSAAARAGRLSMACPNPLPVLVAAVIGLCAGFAGFTLGSAPHGSAAIAPAELRALYTSSETRPALTRGGFVMAAVESTRRKLRAPQRPPAQVLILTGRSVADAPARVEIRLRPAPDLPLETGRANRPFPARGPPV